MSISTKSAWLDGPGDLAEAVVEDVPVKGQSVKVRGLPAQFSNEAQSKALKMITGNRGEQSASVDTAVMSVLQFKHGCVEPEFTQQESQRISEKFGPAFHKVVAKIDELSGVDKDAIEDANATFQTGVEGEGHGGSVEPDPAPAVNSGPTVSSRTGT